ncbi:MBL fold metallo-hydrolase [Ligilactobacillus sp. LYQ60]|uniref:MBL fold metallo-hydrolase n=1 Tax=unclassified Ligilactobacillus TaxID=2767920 RepID=UPI003852C0FF
MKQWTNNIYQITFPAPHPHARAANSFLLYHERLLIDAGFAGTANYARLTAALAQLNLQVTDLRGVVVTHHHPDHVGLLEALPPEIPVYAAPGLAFYGTSAYQQAIDRLKLPVVVPPAVCRNVQQRLETRLVPALRKRTFYPLTALTQFGLHSRTLAGHSAQDTIITDEAGHWFTGDLLLAGIIFNSLLDIDPISQEVVPHLRTRYRQFLRQVETLFPSTATLYPGHGIPFTMKEATRIARQNQRFMARIAEQQAALPAKASYETVVQATLHQLHVPAYFYVSALY